jgi:hypothetical protein
MVCRIPALPTQSQVSVDRCRCRRARSRCRQRDRLRRGGPALGRAEAAAPCRAPSAGARLRRETDPATFDSRSWPTTKPCQPDPRACGDRGRADREADVRWFGVPDQRQHVGQREQPGRSAAASRPRAHRLAPRSAPCRAIRDARTSDAGMASCRARGLGVQARAPAMGQARGQLRPIAAEQVNGGASVGRGRRSRRGRSATRASSDRPG